MISDVGLKYLAAGIASISFLGTGLGQGIAASRACSAIGRNPEAENKIRTTMIIGCALAESGAIYALIISLILIFVV